MEDKTVELVEIASKEDALAAWDNEAVLIREDEGYVYVYPALGKGYYYPQFDLMRECCLMGFVSTDQASLWARSKGYVAYEVRNSHG